MSVPSPCNTHAPPSQLRAKRWQSGDWEPSRGWGPCPCLTQGLQFPVTPTLLSRLRLLGQVGGSWGQAFIGHLLHARHWHSAFLESSNNPVGGSGEKTGPEGSRPPRATLLRGSPPASSPAGTGRRSGLWDSRDRRTRRRSRPKVAATSAAPISGTCILRGGARWLLPRSPMWGGAKRLPWFPAEFGGTVHAPLIGGACLLEGGGAFWQPGAPQGFRIP